MKTAYQIAKEMGINPQKVYRAIQSSGIESTIPQYSVNYSVRNKKRNTKYYDNTAEWRIHAIFNYSANYSARNKSDENYSAGENEKDNLLIDQLRSEIEFLRGQVHHLTTQLGNSQLLLGMEKAKRPWWRRLASSLRPNPSSLRTERSNPE